MKYIFTFYDWIIMNQFVSSHPEYCNKSEYCAIRTRLPENPDTNRAVIVLPGLMYRGWIASGDMDTIVREKNDAAHIHFDYPKTEFVMDKVLQQIRDYIKECPYDEIVLVGISFGGMLSRHLINSLSDDAKKKIKHLISVNGLWTKEDLVLKLKLPLLLGNVKWKIINTITGWVGKLSRKLWGIVTKHQIYRKELLQQIKNNPDNTAAITQKAKHHYKAAANWITPWYADRAKWVISDTEIQETKGVDTSFIYATNDDFYQDPKQHAEKMWNKVLDAQVDYYEVEWWRHQALVELPEKYNPVLEKVFDIVWEKNHEWEKSVV